MLSPTLVDEFGAEISYLSAYEQGDKQSGLANQRCGVDPPHPCRPARTSLCGAAIAFCTKNLAIVDKAGSLIAPITAGAEQWSIACAITLRA